MNKFRKVQKKMIFTIIQQSLNLVDSITAGVHYLDKTYYTQ
jgi:hypothetical protein